MDYISVTDASKKWGISPRRIQILCAEGRVDGLIRMGRMWLIPKDAPKPSDPRKEKNRLKRVVEKSDVQE